MIMVLTPDLLGNSTYLTVRSIASTVIHASWLHTQTLALPSSAHPFQSEMWEWINRTWELCGCYLEDVDISVFLKNINVISSIFASRFPSSIYIGKGVCTGFFFFWDTSLLVIHRSISAHVTISHRTMLTLWSKWDCGICSQTGIIHKSALQKDNWDLKFKFKKNWELKIMTDLLTAVRQKMREKHKL